MNLYEINGWIRVGRKNSTHFNQTVTVHTSNATAEAAAKDGEKRLDRWARRKYDWFIGDEKDIPVTVSVTGVKLIDQDWQ